MSLFNFLSGKSSSPAPSMFGGMNVTSPVNEEPTTATAATTAPAEINSGFSFLSSQPVHNAVETTPNPNPNPTTSLESSSSFAFLNASPEPYVLANNNNTNAGNGHSSQSFNSDIKLSKVAMTKTVKKKRRGTRVGFARDGEEDDEDDSHVHSPVSHSTSQSNGHESHESNAQSHVVHAPTVVENNLDHIQMTQPQYSVPPPPPQSSPPPIPEDVIKVTHTDIVEPGKDPVHNHESAVVQEKHVEDTPVSIPLRENKSQERLNIMEDLKGLEITPQKQTLSIVEKVVEKPIEEKVNENVFAPAQVICDSIKQDFDNLRLAASNIAQRQLNITKEIATSQNEIKRQESSIIDINSRLVDIETEQHNAALMEDFEKADRLSNTIDTLRKQLADANISIVNLKSSIANLEGQLSFNRSAQVDALRKTITTVTSACKEEDEIFTEILRNIDAKHYLERAKLKEEDERIESERIHIDKEENSLTEESTMIEDTIKSQCGDVAENKSLLELELSTVTNEIAELERTLNAKRADEKVLKNALTTLDQRIHDIRRKYDRQLNRIQERRDLLDKTKYEWSLEKAQVSTLLRELEIASNEIEMSKNDITLTSSAAKSEIESLWTLENALVSLVNFSQNEKASPSSSYESALSAVLASELETSTLIGQLSDLKTQLEMLNVEGLDIIDDKLPKLEIEKKAHAAAKRFKEAAQAAKDIKTMTTRKEEIDASVVDISSQISAKDIEIIQVTERHHKNVAYLRELQLEVDKIRFADILQQLSILKNAKKILESQNIDVIMPSHASCLAYISIEIQILTDEADVLNQRHHLSDKPADEFGNESEDDDHDNVGESTETVQETIVSNASSVEEQDTEIQTSNVSDDLVEDDVVDMTNSEPIAEPEHAQEDKDELLRQREEHTALVAKLTDELKVATEEENYELAAILYDTLEETKTHLEEVTAKLALLE